MTQYARIRSKLYREARYLNRDVRQFLGLDNQFYKNARGSRMLITTAFVNMTIPGLILFF